MDSVSLQQLTRMLDEEIADLTAVEAALVVLEAKLDAATRRPVDIRARIAAARSLMEDLASKPRDDSALSQTPQIEEATRWASETRLDALRTEIAMLDQELLSHTARNELLKAQRDEATHEASRIHQRIDVLRAAAGERRHLETELAMTQARAELVELDKLSARERGRPGTAQIDKAHRNARRKLELEGARAPVGMAILAERRQFPNTTEFAKERRGLSRSIVVVSLRLIDAEEDRRALTDVGAYLNGRIAEAGEGRLDSPLRRELESLATTRRSLLDRAIANDVALQRRLYELDDALHRLTDRMTAYDEFLAKRLLWVRSTRAIDAAALARLPSELTDYMSPGPWLETARESAVRLVRAPAFSLIVLLAFGLGWGRGRFRASLVECGRSVGRVPEDSMRSTFKALGFSLLLAAPVPLALGAVGGALSTAGDAAAFASAVGSALLKTASWISLPIVMRALFLPGGVANRHFGWNDGVLAELRRHLAWFVGLAFPLYFVLRTSLVVEPPAYAGGTLTFLCFAGIMAGLLALIIGTAHPTKGSVRQFLATRSGGAQWRWRYVGFPLVVLLPVALVALGWFGYAYTAQELMRRLFQSIWLLLPVWLGAALVRRWLLMTGRRLASQETLENRGAVPPPRAEGGEGANVGDETPSSCWRSY
jgi:potassium efflux system protein